VPWLEELNPPQVEAFLVASARLVVPDYGARTTDVFSQKLVQQYEPLLQKHVSRRQRRLLEELAPHIAAPHGTPPPAEPFVASLMRAELRAAYLLTGDLLAAIDELRAMDGHLHRATQTASRLALHAVLDHAYAGDLVRFALSSEATALRRRIGASWTGG
jgi:hypothetical protein